MVFQNYALYPHMTVETNIGFPLAMRRVAKAVVAQRVREVAALVGLTDHLKKYPDQLSGGQRQRVALGRAIIREPVAFLMDEPLSNLDALLRVQMRSELLKLHRRVGRTTIYVTHDQIEAMTMADRIVVLRDGVVQQVGTTERGLRPSRQHLRRHLRRQSADEPHRGARSLADGGAPPLRGAGAQSISTVWRRATCPPRR